MAFRDGYHDFSIQTGGIEVYPRLIAAQHLESHAEENVPSDVPHLDALLGGGVDRGSSLLIIGAAGVGKSTLATQYAVAGGRRGEKAVVFIFDETVWTYRARAEKLGFPMTALVADETLTLRQIDPAEVSAGQFTNMVMQAVDGGVRTVVIDSLTGYLNTMPEERFLVAYLHELLTTLSHKNVVTILTLAQHGLVGEHEVDRRQNRGIQADRGDVAFDRVLAVEVWNARVGIGRADGGEDEMDPGRFGRVRGGDALPGLGVRAFRRRCDREEGGRLFECLG